MAIAVGVYLFPSSAKNHNSLPSGMARFEFSAGKLQHLSDFSRTTASCRMAGLHSSLFFRSLRFSHYHRHFVHCTTHPCFMGDDGKLALFHSSTTIVSQPSACMAHSTRALKSPVDTSHRRLRLGLGGYANLAHILPAVAGAIHSASCLETLSES